MVSWPVSRRRRASASFAFWRRTTTGMASCRGVDVSIIMNCDGETGRPPCAGPVFAVPERPIFQISFMASAPWRRRRRDAGAMASCPGVTMKLFPLFLARLCVGRRRTGEP